MMNKLLAKIRGLFAGKKPVEPDEPDKEEEYIAPKKPEPLWKNATLKLAMQFYRQGKHRELAVILPHLRDIDHPFIKGLLESRILRLGHVFDRAHSDFLRDVTIGADPEFILQDENGDVVLFSSEHAHGNIVMSEATLGADYGLMEFRLPATLTPEELLENLDDYHDTAYDLYENVGSIMKAEAVLFDHKLARTRELMNDEKRDFGMNVRKNFAVEAEINIDDESSYFDISISAFGEPLFKPKRTDILSAGGHLHIGGTFVKMFNLQQAKAYIRRVDLRVRAICNKIETPAAELRREVYGCPGEFRIKTYGLEYRTPSNVLFWPENDAYLFEVYNIMIEEARTFFFKEEHDPTKHNSQIVSQGT